MKLKASVSFLSIEVEHVNSHSSACLTQNKRSRNLQQSKKTLELERNFGAFAASPSMVMFFSSFLFQNFSNQHRLAVKS